MSLKTEEVVHEGITFRIHTLHGEPVNWVADTPTGPVVIPEQMQPAIRALLEPYYYQGTCWCCGFQTEADIPEASCSECGKLSMEWW